MELSAHRISPYRGLSRRKFKLGLYRLRKPTAKNPSLLHVLVALMLDTGSIEMVGVELEVGRASFERKQTGWFAHNFNFMPAGTRWERRDFEGEPIVLVLGPYGGHEALLSVMRFENDEDRISRVHSYAFSPETIAEVANALGMRIGPAMYSFLDLQG